MRRFFYLRMAGANIKKNGKFYIPYILASSGVIMMFYVMCFILFNDGIKSLPGSAVLTSILGFGSVIVGLFSVIFIFYANSFLIKRRKKEFGLFNILGMEKRHIARIMFNETTLTAIVSIAGGLALGVLFSGIVFLFLYKIINIEASFSLNVSAPAIMITIALFVLIFLLALIFNLIRVKVSNPIDLLKGGNVGEKEPKTRWVIAVLGFVCLIAGYIMALTTESPLSALSLFFLASLLVIIGTYFLFIAGTIAILKIMKKNKKFYYTPKNFTAVSGMLYRMKQNAVGLASIAVLSAMVLVVVSTTVSLYVGMEDVMNNRYPTDMSINLINPTKENSDALLKIVNDTVADKGLETKNLLYYQRLSFVVYKQGPKFVLDNEYTGTGFDPTVIYFVSVDEFNRLNNDNLTLNNNEVAVYAFRGQIDDEFELLDEKYTIKKRIEEFPRAGIDSAVMYDTIYLIMSGEDKINKIYEKQKTLYQDRANDITFTMDFDLDASDERILNCYNNIKSNLSSSLKDERIRFECKQDSKKEFYSLYGGLFFLGIFLGILFLMATVLIIYYKQISEGYDDKQRFEIMQKVGMSFEEVKATIRSQVLMVFFLPIIIAIMHVAFAFRMITKMLAVFNLSNIPLFLICMIITIVVFAIVYGLVYRSTAKTYYNIVQIK